MRYRKPGHVMQGVCIMKKLKRLWQSSVWIVTLLSSLSMAAQSPVGPGSGGQKVHLSGPWQIQSSCKVAEKGDQISVASFQPSGWYPATVPGAVVANLVRHKEANYPDPYTGMSLRQMPGVN